MSDVDVRSDALVFFGATGDLVYKRIFPARQAMVKRGHLDVPVIGVAKAGWSLEQLQARAEVSLEEHGGLDPAAFDTLCGLLRYVDGDYRDPAMFRGAAHQDGHDARARHRREAVRPRRRLRAEAQPRPARSLRRGIDLDLRPPRNGPWLFGVSRE